MTPAADPIDLLTNVLFDLSTVLDGTSPEQRDLQTPCASWTVGDVVNHVLNDVTQFTTAALGGTMDWSTPAPEVDANWSSVLDERARALLVAWRANVGSHDAIGMQVSELALHAWDLAQATGQDLVLDPAVAEQSLAWMSGMLQPEYRGTEAEGKVFGPEQPAPDDASPTEKLVAFSGRRPR